MFQSISRVLVRPQNNLCAGHGEVHKPGSCPASSSAFHMIFLIVLTAFSALFLIRLRVSRLAYDIYKLILFSELSELIGGQGDLPMVLLVVLVEIYCRCGTLKHIPLFQHSFLASKMPPWLGFDSEACDLILQGSDGHTPKNYC